MNIDDGLEDIRWIHGLWGECLPAASYGILPNLKKKVPGIFCHYIRDEWRRFVFRFVHTNGKLYHFHTAGQLPPHDTGHGVMTAILEWAGAPTERTLLRIYDVVVGVVDRCLSRTRNLDASNQRSA